MGCHSLLQEIFLIQALNLGLLHCRRILYPLSHQGRINYFHISPCLLCAFKMGRLKSLAVGPASFLPSAKGSALLGKAAPDPGCAAEDTNMSESTKGPQGGSVTILQTGGWNHDSTEVEGGCVYCISA